MLAHERVTEWDSAFIGEGRIEVSDVVGFRFRGRQAG